MEAGTRGRAMHWLRRYLPAELAGTAAALRAALPHSARRHVCQGLIAPGALGYRARIRRTVRQALVVIAALAVVGRVIPLPRHLVIAGPPPPRRNRSTRR